MKRIAVLGITGSIGQSTVAVLRAHPDRFALVLASAHNGRQALEDLRSEFKVPHTVLTSTPDGRTRLLELIRTADYDILLNAVSGSAGMEYTHAAVEAGRTVALANKESLVLAGHIIMPLAQTNNCRILPVDSEHSALLQAIGCTPPEDVHKLILTASGGPFRNLPLEDFSSISVQQTLAHPTWSMGAKVTVDSATMLNKGLEIIEAHWLFGIEYDRITAIIHPQSVVHSLVEMTDGSLMAQLSTPTMQLPILYALGYPRRVPSSLVQTSLTELGALTFMPIEQERYPLFFLAQQVGRTGGLLPTVLNAANEAAIRLFLHGHIGFTDIYRLVNIALEYTDNMEEPGLDEIMSVNREVYDRILADYSVLL